MSEIAASFLETIKKYKIIIGIGVAAAISITAGTITFVKIKAQKEESAWQNVWRIDNDLKRSIQVGKNEEDRNAALKTAVDAYEYVKKNKSSSDTMPFILFQLGNIYYELKDYDGAIRTYNDFLQRYKRHQLALLVKQSLGYAYEEKGLFQKAVEVFDSLPGNDKHFLSAQKGWDAGRCYENLGKKDKAIQNYTKTIEYSPDSIWATLARYRLSVIK